MIASEGSLTFSKPVQLLTSSPKFNESRHDAVGAVTSLSSVRLPVCVAAPDPFALPASRLKLLERAMLVSLLKPASLEQRSVS